MSLKPEIIPPEKVIEQIVEMKNLKEQLQVSLTQLTGQVVAIEQSMAENDSLRVGVKKLIEESFNHFQTEWRRKSEYWPDIRLQILTKAYEPYIPPLPKKEEKKNDKKDDGKGEKKT